MKNLDQKLDELYNQIALAQIKNFFEKYKEYYRANSIDFDDLQQEIP